MEQIGNELKKMIKAGMGAVATGVEKTQEAIDALAQKGEPIYEQAKTAVCDAAEKIKKAVDDSGIGDVFSCRPRVESIIQDLMEMNQEELDEIRMALDEIYPHRPSGKKEETPDATAQDDFPPPPEA